MSPARPTHLIFQPEGRVALPPDDMPAHRCGYSTVLHRAPEVEPRDLQAQQFHVLTPIADQHDVRLECSCGWLSGRYSSERAARKILGNECPVDWLRKQSAERRRALRVRLGSGE